MPVVARLRCTSTWFSFDCRYSVVMSKNSSLYTGLIRCIENSYILHKCLQECLHLALDLSARVITW